MDRRKFLQTLSAGIWELTVGPKISPVQGVISASVLRVNKLHDISGINHIIMKEIYDLFECSHIHDDIWDIMWTTSYSRKILRMIDTIDELNWIWFSAIEAPEFDISIWKMEDMEAYIDKLDKQYPIILWRLQQALDNIDISDFNLSTYYANSMWSFKDNEVLHRYDKYEDFSTDYDESTKTILIYDWCNDDGSIPKWAKVLHRIPIDKIRNKYLDEAILERWSEAINKMKKAYSVMKRLEMVRFKLKKVYSFESLGSDKLLTIHDVIGAYQRKIINYYLSLCMHRNTTIDIEKFIQVFQQRSSKEELSELFWVSIDNEYWDYIVSKDNENIFNGPIDWRAIFTDDFIDLLYENSALIRAELESELNFHEIA